MANLIEYIQSQVYENSTEDISGSIMQQVLTRMASDEGVVNVHTITGQTPFADYNNAQAARDAVPAGFKKLGLIITYKLSSGWYIDEFIGSATSGWSTASNWKCLGPISVSQNASTGKTTITIGSQSYDVATQPVSVSQNTQTDKTTITVGPDSTVIDSAIQEINKKGYVNISPNISNFYNYKSDLVNCDINTTTGEITPLNGYNVSDKIRMDFTKDIVISAYYKYAYCFDADDNYLGRITVNSPTILANTYATVAYIRILTHGQDQQATTMVQYNTTPYLPFNPVSGFIDERVARKGSLFATKLTYDYNTKKLKFVGLGSASTIYIICDNGDTINTGLAYSDEFTMPNNNYFSIVYDKSDGEFKGIFDYQGNLSNLIFIGNIIYQTVVGWCGTPISVNGNSMEPLKYGWFFKDSYIDYITASNKLVFHLGQSLGDILMCNDGSYFDTNFANEQEFSFTYSQYGTIVYDVLNKTIIGLQDYTKSYSRYVILGYWDNIRGIFGNLCKFRVNGVPVNDVPQSVLDTLSQHTSAINSLNTSVSDNADDISAEATARQLADTALGARIDNLVLESGGDSNLEVVDARTDAAGVTHATLEARLNSDYNKFFKKIGKIITVGATNSDYTTIAAAISAANNGDIVFIKRGTYEESVENLDKCVHIVGESKDEVIWKYPNTEYSAPCYDCGMGSIRNLTMYAYDNGQTPSGQYGRAYCVHLDHFGHYEQVPPISNYFYCENVYFLNDSNEAVGLGLRPNMVMEFVNCDFETLQGNEACFYVHSSTSPLTVNAKCIIKNCTIKNNTTTGQQPALRIEGYWETDGGCTAVLERNIVVNIGGGLAFEMQKSHHYGSQTVENWQGISDWLLDVRSQLNNISDINYSA